MPVNWTNCWMLRPTKQKLNKKNKKKRDPTHQNESRLHLTNRKFFVKAFLPAIFWGIVIAVLSLMPGKNMPEVIWDIANPDKLAHAFVYMILSFLLFRGFYLRGQLKRETIIWGLFISIVYGILLEILQYAFFPDRYFELLDIIANIIGSILSLVLIKFFLQ